VQNILDGRIISEVLIDPIRGIVNRRFGGDVQAALGQAG
jgi:hypothetical protein